MNFNKHLLSSKPYTLVSHKAWELENFNQVLKLDWNESALECSPKVKEAIIEFVNSKPLHWYPDVLNHELLSQLSIYTGLNIENIQYFASSDSLHEYILRLFYNNNSEITIISPTYDNFRSTAESMGYKLNYFYLDSEFILDEIKLLDQLKFKRQDLVYICSPNNPTGTEISNVFFEKLAYEFPETAFFIDEAYFEFSNFTAASLIERYPNILISRTFSKAFGLASLRIGYLLADKNLINLVNKIRNPKNISSLSQIGAIAALQDISHLNKNLKYIDEGKLKIIDFIQKKLNNHIHIYFGGGNFILLCIHDNKAKDLCQYFQKNNIFIRDLNHLKALQNYIRVTVGTITQMDVLINILSEFYNVEK